MKVSKAKPEDAEGILNVQRTTWIATYPNEAYGITKEDIEQQVTKFGNNLAQRIAEAGPEKCWLVAKVDTKIVGMCFLLRGEDKNTLQALYILPEFHSRGIGSKLVLAALEWLGREKEVILGVATYNLKALNFYKKFGFVDSGPWKGKTIVLPSGKILPEREMILKAK